MGPKGPRTRQENNGAMIDIGTLRRLVSEYYALSGTDTATEDIINTLMKEIKTRDIIIATLRKEENEVG